MKLALRVKPGSARPGFARESGQLVLRVRERAVEGAANAACIAALSRRLGLPPSAIALVRGHRSRDKTFELRWGGDPAALLGELP